MADKFTLDDLRRILRVAAGGDSALDGDILDVSFDALGYDSLALLETGSRIGREFDVELEDSAFIDAETPREMMEVVNAYLARAA